MRAQSPISPSASRPPGSTLLSGLPADFKGSVTFIQATPTNEADIVVDITTSPWRTVAGFYENQTSRDYGLRHAARLIDEYQPQLVCVEKNGVGAAVAEALVLRGED